MATRLANHPLAYAALVAAASLSCSREVEELPPFGEVLVEIDTNLKVPDSIDRVRVDLYAGDAWIESRDFATPDKDDFPLSFSVFNDSFAVPREVLVRVRAYPEGRLRDYRGERFQQRPEFIEPSSAASLSAACGAAPVIELGKPSTLRLRAEPFADGSVSCLGVASASGLAAFQIDIAEAATYRLEVVSAEPGFEWFFAADTLLSLRSSCEAATSELACNDNAAQFGVLSGLTQAFNPGTYFVVIGNAQPGPMDVTLLVDRAEQFFDEGPSPPAEEPGDGNPRLIIEGVDVTPRKEPLPSLTVDRLALIQVEPARQSTDKLLLSGECLGTMADLFGRTTCIDTENVRVAVEPEPLVAGHQHSKSNVVGAWSRYDGVPCTAGAKSRTTVGGVELFDEQVCIDGGSFVLGDISVLGRDDDAGQPERFAAIAPFLMDKFEYTVGRYRAARLAGFEPPDEGPFNNFDPIELIPDRANVSCTYNELLDKTALFPERETLALSCVSWRTARALCQREGGDLPTVAQREYAAAAADREDETTYPWGDDTPACDHALWGRWIDPTRGSTECRDFGLGTGPVEVAAEPWASRDVTPSGVVGLGGSLAEWTLDSHRGYSDACWQSQPIADPMCWEAEAPLRSIAGASWRDPAGRARAAMRVRGAVAGLDPSVGFRCVYPAGGG